MATSKGKRVRINHMSYDFGVPEDDIRLILSNTEEHKNNWRTVKTVSLVLFEAIKERLIEEAQKIQEVREAKENNDPRSPSARLSTIGRVSTNERSVRRSKAERGASRTRLYI